MCIAADESRGLGSSSLLSNEAVEIRLVSNLSPASHRVTATLTATVLISMEVIGAVASFIAIGQAIEKCPKTYRLLRSIVNPGKEVAELADEVIPGQEKIHLQGLTRRTSP
jgi:hypothetical protein